MKKRHSEEQIIRILREAEAHEVPIRADNTTLLRATRGELSASFGSLSIARRREPLGNWLDLIDPAPTPHDVRVVAPACTIADQ